MFVKVTKIRKDAMTGSSCMIACATDCASCKIEQDERIEISQGCNFCCVDGDCNKLKK